jgi:hypothetical protein
MLVIGSDFARGESPAAPAVAAGAPVVSSGRPEFSALLFYATNGDGSDATDRIADDKGEGPRLSPALAKAFPFQKYVLIGQHRAELGDKYNTWLLASPQFPVELENYGSAPSGGHSLLVKLWQKERQPAKDRELVKTNAILVPGTPLIIGVPKWRQGRLVMVVRREK